MWLFITGIFFLILAVERVEVKRSGMDVARLRAEVSFKENQNQYLRFMINEMSGPKIIYKEAEERLGMKMTPAREIVILEDK